MKKIGYLGAGIWGIALATILAKNGHKVVVWDRNEERAKQLQATRKHPKLKDFTVPESLRFTSHLGEVLDGAEVLVESVTSNGIRPVFEEIGNLNIPIILTSKGIEQKSLLFLPEVVAEVLGEKKHVGVLTGPSIADEVIRGNPASVVCSAYDPAVTKLIQELFTTPEFRIYPNSDLPGVCFGGAIKNVVAIACGIADGLGYGDNAKAALMTRGLHEMRKLSLAKHAKPETLNGLSGMGDLCVTCLSKHSRNYRFGLLIAEGLSPDAARAKIGMAVEGFYACVSARELAHKHNIPVPITEVTHAILHEGKDPKAAVKALLTRPIKDEPL